MGNGLGNGPLDYRGKSRGGGVPTVIGSVQVLPGNARRVGATFVNDGAAIMYLAKGELSVVNTAIRLNAGGGAYEINLTNPWKGPISVACGAVGEVLCWTEDE